MKKIVITGSKGFIGQKLVSALRKSDDYTLEEFSREKHDLLDFKTLLDLVENSEAVIHLAGITKSSNQDIEQVNIEGTRNLLEAVRRVAPSSLFLFASSFAVYSTPLSGDIIGEDYPTKPYSKYGLTKLQAEELVKDYSQKYCLKSLAVRLSNVYGSNASPFAHSVVATFMHQILNGLDIQIDGDGQQTRDFIYVDDVVEAIIKAVKYKMSFEDQVINICSGTETSLLTLIQEIEDCTGHASAIKFCKTNGMIGGYWRGNFALAKTILGWEPNIVLREGLSKIYQHIKYEKL